MGSAPMIQGPRCCFQIMRGFHFNQCRRRGITTTDGKLYCLQHEPGNVQKRKEQRERGYKMTSFKLDAIRDYDNARITLADLVQAYPGRMFPADVASQMIKVTMARLALDKHAT